MNAEAKLYPTFQNPLLIQPVKPLPKEIAVIGAGTIGPDIGYYLKSALPGIKLYLVDVADAPLQNAEKRLSGYAQKAVEKKKMTAEKAKEVLADIFYTKEYGQLKSCELIIEAATESIPLKQKIFAALEQVVGPDAIITSNTSSIPADRLFTQMERPQRATVTHFFAPAWRSLPVEVIQWPGADQATVDYLYWFFATTGKAPIKTDNAICFVLDRIFDNWCNESAYLLDSATAAQIDKVAEAFVFAGPFFVLNLANGNPIIVETNTLQMEEGPCYRPAAILNSVERWKTASPGAEVPVPDALKKAVRDRLLGILFSQSFDIIDRGIGTPGDLNFGCQVALGFRKGPLDIMRKLGQEEVRRIMADFDAQRPGFPKATRPVGEYQRFKRFLLVDTVDDIKIITLRRPQAMNAITDEITDEILAVLQHYEQDPTVKGFVITGYGTAAFSAGADIGKFPETLGDLQASVQYARDYGKLQRYLDQMPKPVVAALNGMALGGGLELAIRCHAIVAMKDARLQFPEITLGIIPGIGGCIVPYRRWPKGAALFHEMITLAKPVTAEEAGDFGMVSATAGSYAELMEKALGQVHDLAGRTREMASGPVDIPEIVIPESPRSGRLALSRRSVSIAAEVIRKGAAAEDVYSALEVGYQGFGEVACTPDAKEGISAFLQKRKPEFTS